MLYLKLYAAISFVIGVIYTVYALYITRKEASTLTNKAVENFLDEHVDKDHIQKETYDARRVYYRKDNVGQAVIDATEIQARLVSKHRLLYFLMMFVVGSIWVAVAWPKILYEFVKKRPDNSPAD